MADVRRRKSRLHELNLRLSATASKSSSVLSPFHYAWITGNPTVTFRVLIGFKLTDRRPPCKSLSSEKHKISGRAQESALPDLIRISIHAAVASRLVVPALAEPDIHLRSKTRKSPHRRLSLCSLPVPKQFRVSLRSLISFAQSANGGTWQPAHRNNQSAEITGHQMRSTGKFHRRYQSRSHSPVSAITYELGAPLLGFVRQCRMPRP
jgi:hypothetical protein